MCCLDGPHGSGLTVAIPPVSTSLIMITPTRTIPGSGHLTLRDCEHEVDRPLEQERRETVTSSALREEQASSRFLIVSVSGLIAVMVLAPVAAAGGGSTPPTRLAVNPMPAPPFERTAPPMP